MIEQQMESYTCSSSSFGLSRVSSTVSAISCYLFFAISALVFAAVGTTVGGISGGLGGVKSKSGFLHGAAVGSIMGCFLSAEIFKASFAMFDSDDSTFGCFISLIKYCSNCLRETLIRGSFSSHVNVVEQSNIAQIMHNQVQQPPLCPKIILTDKDIVDSLGNGSSCSICLQDFHLGETVCRLPNCHHNFHLLCICKWFIRHNSCPLCRTTLSRTRIALMFKMQDEFRNVR